MKKLTILLFSLAFLSNTFGMEKNSDQSIIDYTGIPFDVVAELQENNKLLRDIKRQNRVIIKQNNLNHQYQTLHTELCNPRTIAYSCTEKEHLHKKYTLASKMKEIYIAETIADRSWESSEEGK